MIGVSVFYQNPAPISEIPAGAWGAVAFMAFFTTVLGYLFWNEGIRTLGVNKTSVFFNLVPVVTMIISFLSGMTISWIQAVGAALVITGVIAASGGGMHVKINANRHKGHFLSKKIWIVTGYIAAAIVLLLYKDPLVHWMKDADASEIPVFIGVAVIIALVPVVPYGVIAGVIGFKYGPVWGGFINVAGSTIAALLMFLMVRYVFQEQGRHWLEKWGAVNRFVMLMENNAFIAVLIARLIPIIPAAAVNVYSAISRIRPGTFMLATVLGKIPVMFVFAIIGDQLFKSWTYAGLTALIYGLFLFGVYLLYRTWQARRKNSGEEEARMQL